MAEYPYFIQMMVSAADDARDGAADYTDARRGPVMLDDGDDEPLGVGRAHAADLDGDFM
jgi:hypothetical protein